MPHREFSIPKFYHNNYRINNTEVVQHSKPPTRTFKQTKNPKKIVKLRQHPLRARDPRSVRNLQTLRRTAPLLRQFGFDPPSDVRPRVLSQMVFSVKTLTAFRANVSLLSRMYHEMQRELLLALERFQTNRANVRPLRIVRLFVTRQVVFTLQTSPANVAHESTFESVAY